MSAVNSYVGLFLRSADNITSIAVILAFVPSLTLQLTFGKCFIHILVSLMYPCGSQTGKAIMDKEQQSNDISDSAANQVSITSSRQRRLPSFSCIHHPNYPKEVR